MTHVSHNELQNTLERALESIGFRYGERVEAAEAVVWMELHGLGGIAALIAALDYVPQEARARLREHYHRSGLRVFSAGGMSILNVARLAIETGLAMARDYALAEVRIEECHNRALILGYLAQANPGGINMLAVWADAHQSCLHRVWMDDSDRLPKFCRQEGASLPRGDQSLVILFSQIARLGPGFAGETGEAHASSQLNLENMEKTRKRSLEEGLFVGDPQWAVLKDMAAGVLVDDGM